FGRPRGGPAGVGRRTAMRWTRTTLPRATRCTPEVEFLEDRTLPSHFALPSHLHSPDSPPHQSVVGPAQAAEVVPVDHQSHANEVLVPAQAPSPAHDTEARPEPPTITAPEVEHKPPAAREGNDSSAAGQADTFLNSTENTAKDRPDGGE